MKTLYIHVGTHKTGTTSLQRFLEVNQRNLKKIGFCYPPIYSVFKRFKFSNSPLINGTFLLEPIMNKSFDKGFKKLFNTFKRFDNVILSDEMLARGIGMPKAIPWGSKANVFDNLSYLNKLCEKKNITIKFIIYVRRQDKFIESMFCEEIKSGSTLTIDRVKENYKNYMDYSNIIKKLNTISNDVIVRNYENLVNNDVCENFLQIFNLNILNFKKIPRENDKLERNACMLQSLINKMNVEYAFKVYNAYMLMTKGYNKINRHFLTKKEAQELVNSYRLCNMMLEKKYKIFFNKDYSQYVDSEGLDTQLLSEDISAYINNVFKVLNN